MAVRSVINLAKIIIDSAIKMVQMVDLAKAGNMVIKAHLMDMVSMHKK